MLQILETYHHFERLITHFRELAVLVGPHDGLRQQLDVLEKWPVKGLVHAAVRFLGARGKD